MSEQPPEWASPEDPSPYQVPDDGWPTIHPDHPPAVAYGPGPVQNQLALWAMIAGIASVVFGLCCAFVAFPGGLVALGLGVAGLKHVNASRGQQTGSGMAITGIVLGITAVLIGVGSLVYLLVNNPGLGA